jgi:hypothetical protein
MNSKNSKKLLSKLAPQQLEVLKRVCKGYPYKKIAKEMFISLSTVKAHMTAVYEKLELTDLSKDDRKFQIRLIYCPLLQELEGTYPQEQPIQELESEIESASIPLDEEEIIDVFQETELKSKAEEEITNGDEEEIITITPKPKNGGRKKMGTGKGRRALRLVLVLIVAALIVFGGWQGLKWLSNIPMGSSGSAYEVGEWVKKDDVWVRLSDYEVTGTMIALDVEVWNKTGQEYFFSWDAENNFSMVDNLNDKYEVAGGYLRKVNLDTNERMKIPGHSIGTIDFKNDPLYKSGVTDLYVTMEYFSTIDEAVFHIAVGN